LRIDEKNGWFGGTILDLAIKHDIVLAATLAGIQRSTDGGRSGRRVGNRLPDSFTQAVALTTDGESGLAMAASNAGWLYISHDQGKSWETVSSWRNVGSITRVAVSPNVSTDGIVLACTAENGIYKSTDHGRTWKAANFGLLNLSVLSLTFSSDFGRDEVILAGTDGGGLFRSRNAARAWRESGKGLPDATVQSIAFSPAFGEDGTVFAGTDECGLYRSTDKARTWLPVSDTLAQTCVNSVVVADDWTSGGKIVIATDESVRVSVDAGASWQLGDNGVADPYTLIRTRDALLVGTFRKGVFRSRDGCTWHGSNSGLAGHLPPLTAFSDAFEHDHALVMASAEGELARTQDGGQSWTTLPVGFDVAGITALAGTGAGRAMSLFAAIPGALIRSRDGGDTWTPMVDTESPITALSVSRAFAHDGSVMIGTGDGQVLVSQDQGTSWRQGCSFSEEAVIALVSTGQGEGQGADYAVTARPTAAAVWQLTLRECGSGKTLFIHRAQQPTSVLQYTPDSDLLFCALGSHLLCLQRGTLIAESELADNTPVSCLAVDGERLFAGTRIGLCVSTDRGQSWYPVASEGAIVALHTAAPGQVYAVEMGGRLRKVNGDT
jgi:photosystem II stability/assembly factor-like uncharacterized protein